MFGLGKGRQENFDDVEINLVPVMNMFLVLVPFLLLSAAFFQLKAIDTSVPILAETSRDALGTQDVKVTVIMEIMKEGIHLSAISDSLGHEALNQWDALIVKEKQDEYPLMQLLLHLQKIKEAYPASNTIILVPDGGILYDTIIKVMDVARYVDDKPLFPNMVLSGKVG